MLMPVEKCGDPLILVRCRPSRILPISVVKVVRTSGPLPPMLMRPTDDSGFDWILAEKMRLTASSCASNRDGLDRYKHANLQGTRCKLTHSRRSCCSHCCLPCFRVSRLKLPAGEGSSAYTIIDASNTILTDVRGCRYRRCDRCRRGRCMREETDVAQNDGVGWWKVD